MPANPFSGQLAGVLPLLNVFNIKNRTERYDAHFTAEEFFNPNCVKVVRAADGHALYFSRAPVPWPRDAFAHARERLPAGVILLRHIGIYAYRAGFLRTFAKLPRTPLERAESLEQLRALEHGFRIAVSVAPEPFPAGVDTPEDLARVQRLLPG